ncbi:50S ribosomal protein L22 [bacterium]|nr:50S ribosomal protein L22 [bacterium]
MGRREREQKKRREATIPTTQDGRQVVSKSVTRFVRCAPRKMAIVADLIRDKPVVEALEILQFTHRPSAIPYIERTLKSAIANAENVAPDPYELVVGEIRVEGAPMLKRIRPASMGRAVRVRKRMSHLSILLTSE